MEAVKPLEQLLAMFGVDLTTLGSLSAMVFLLVELLKNKIGKNAAGKFILSGWKTDVAAILLAGGISAKALMPATPDAWISWAALTAACWLIPAAVHAKLKPADTKQTGGN